jgi:hypothetical protein
VLPYGLPLVPVSVDKLGEQCGEPGIGPGGPTLDLRQDPLLAGARLMTNLR